MTVISHPVLFNCLKSREDTASAKTPQGFASDQRRLLSPREDSRIAANLDWHLKALINHSVNGNSAFFSRSEKATFAEILKLDSLSQVSDPKNSEAVAQDPNVKS